MTGPVTVKKVEQCVHRGDELQFDVVANHTREPNPRGFYHSDLELKCTLKWMSSLGEIMSSSASRYRIMISRREVYHCYCKDGVKTILYTLMNQYPQVYRVRAQEYLKTSEEQKESVPDRGILRAMVEIQRWEDNGCVGECPDFKWKRSWKKFWKMVNIRGEGSRKKVMKTFFSTKLHPCPHCKEFEEEIAIYEESKRAYEAEKDTETKEVIKQRLDQWTEKIVGLRRHKDNTKHNAQRFRNGSVNATIIPVCVSSTKISATCTKQTMRKC